MMRSRRSRWIAGIAVVVVLIAGVVWTLIPGGSPLDSTADDGYLGLKLLLEQRGATVTELDGGDVRAETAKEYDVVFVLRSAGVDRDQLAQWHHFMAAGGRLVLGEPDRAAETTATSGSDPTTTAAPTVDEPGAPSAAGAVGQIVAPGNCELPGAEGLPSLHSGGVAGHHVYANEASCYGDATAAIVTSATCLEGEQFTLTAPSIFDNATMGSPTDERRTVEERGNATVAAYVLAPLPGQRVAIVTDGVRTSFGSATASPDEPTCGSIPDDDSLWQSPTLPSDDGTEQADGKPTDRPSATTVDGESGSGSGESAAGRPGGESGGTDSGSGGDASSGGGIDGSGGANGGGTRSGGSGGEGDQQSTGAGTAKPPPSLFDFLSPGLKLALAQLLAVLVWYAWRRSRRRSVVVEDEAPVALTSSRRVEAVGAFRRRGGESRRAGEELREHTRSALSSELGLGRDADRAHVAAAAAARIGRPVPEIVALLDGPPIDDEDELLALASSLQRLRVATANSLIGQVPT